MVWEMFFWSTLGLSISIDATLNNADYLNIVADHGHAIVYDYNVPLWRLSLSLAQCILALGSISLKLD